LFRKVNLVATIQHFHDCLALLVDVTHFITITLTVKNQNTFTNKEEYLSSGNACFHSVVKLLSLCVTSENLKKKYKIIILPVILYGCETLSLAKDWLI
jgi:hypothetical protein